MALKHAFNADKTLLDNPHGIYKPTVGFYNTWTTKRMEEMQLENEKLAALKSFRINTWKWTNGNLFFFETFYNKVQTSSIQSC